MDAKKSIFFGLLRRREGLVPTWRGWGLCCVVLILVATLAIRGAYPFLAVNQPEPGGVLVVEGWVQDYVLEGVIAEFGRHHYDQVFVTGGPMELGGILSGYTNHAQLGLATLLKLGISSNVVQAVPSPAVRQDRTYASAIALKQWWRANHMAPDRVNLISVGPHARRSRLLFQKALGNGVAVGIVAYPPQGYDPRHWWRSSNGFRNVVDEIIAYGYARLLFRQPKEEDVN